MNRNAHWGSKFDDFLEEQGMLQEANIYATKRILVWKIAEAMKELSISKPDMARRMKTSQSSLEMLLDPENISLNLETMEKAAAALGKKIKIELV